jgi:hypothetical protein
MASIAQLSKSRVEFQNGIDGSVEFDLRNGVSIETKMTGKQKVAVIITSGGKSFKIPVDTVGAASRLSSEFCALLREMERL